MPIVRHTVGSGQVVLRAHSNPREFPMASLLEPQQVVAEQRFVIRGVDWETSPAHEIYKTRFGRLLEALAYELNVELLSGFVAQVRHHFTPKDG